MGGHLALPFREFRNIDHIISVKTGDRKGTGTDANVYIALHDEAGRRSQDIHLDRWFRNDLERGNTDLFECKSGVPDFGPVSRLEIWRDSKGLLDDWFCEVIKIENYKSKETYEFPVNRWIPANAKFWLTEYDMVLPQNDVNVEQRREELQMKKSVYQLAARPNIPIPGVKTFPKDESFSFDALFDIKQSALKLRFRANLTILTSRKWKSVDDIEGIFRPPLLPKPDGVTNWKSDKDFGYQRLIGCNPTVIRLCTKIPEKFAVTDDDLRPIIEGMTIEEAIDKKRLFIIDYEYLKDLPCNEDRKICAPKALFFVNKDKNLMPVAIQLWPDPAEDNPVFLPTDPEYTWQLAKLFFNNADASVHQAGTHLGYTHFLMEAVVVATHRSLSPSHPIFRLLAPHFLYLLAINHHGLGFLVNEGGFADRAMGVGRLGMFAAIDRLWQTWRLDRQGSFLKDLEERGVADPDVLPNYHYRDDALLLHKAIYDYVKTIVDHVYDTPEKVAEDYELQEWGRILTRDDTSETTVDIKGLPNDGRFETAQEITDTVTSFIFISSAGHAAVNFSQYDEYCFPPHYPSWLRGDTPRDKNPRTEADIIAQLPSIDVTLTLMIVTKVLSAKGTKSLGDFEVQFIYDPVGVRALEKFRSDLAKISDIIDERNAKREKKYLYLHPKVVPNAISI